jgi:hypothetical protein
MGWQRHTVRGFMAGAMKKAGYTVESFKPENTGAELSRSFQPHFAEQHARDLRIARRRLHMRGKELELLRFALLVEDLNSGQPARLRGTV